MNVACEGDGVFGHVFHLLRVYVAAPFGRVHQLRQVLRDG